MPPPRALVVSLSLALSALCSTPAASRPKVTIARAFVDGDYAFTHGEYRRRTSVAGFDVFRLEDGKLAEHWDAGQMQPDVMANGHTMLDGATDITDLDKTEENKALVRRFVDEVLVQRKLDGLSSYFAGDALVQHSPLIPDGVPAFATSLTRSTLRHEEARRVLGEGNFVLVQLRASVSGKPAVAYDLFRVANDKIAEHWDVFEEVPAHAENGNGMW